MNNEHRVVSFRESLLRRQDTNYRYRHLLQMTGSYILLPARNRSTFRARFPWIDRDGIRSVGSPVARSVSCIPCTIGFASVFVRSLCKRLVQRHLCKLGLDPFRGIQMSRKKSGGILDRQAPSWSLAGSQSFSRNPAVPAAQMLSQSAVIYQVVEPTPLGRQLYRKTPLGRLGARIESCRETCRKAPPP
jgi:hypothetical protein